MSVKSVAESVSRTSARNVKISLVYQQESAVRHAVTEILRTYQFPEPEWTRTVLFRRLPTDWFPTYRTILSNFAFQQQLFKVHIRALFMNPNARLPFPYMTHGCPSIGFSLTLEALTKVLKDLCKDLLPTMQSYLQP